MFQKFGTFHNVKKIFSAAGCFLKNLLSDLSIIFQVFVRQSRIILVNYDGPKWVGEREVCSIVRKGSVMR